jgi:RNA polymerase-binding transcription factor DksA
MTDLADKAQDYQEHAADIREQQRLARLSADLRGLLVTDCIDCGDIIDPARKAAIPGAVRCIGCESVRERRQRTGAYPLATMGGADDAL